MISELGLTVARQLPVEMIGGLLSGAYSLHGGVIRNGAGQIVAHLMSSGASSLMSVVPGLDMLSGAIANGQLLMLAKDVKALQGAVSNVLTVASAGAALSGLGLVVSISGFAYLSKRLQQIESQILKVKDLIETKNLAELKAAMGHMKSAEAVTMIGEENRRSLLLEAQKNFSALSHLYGDLWSKSDEAKQMPILENLFTLSFTGASIANSELGMHDVAVLQFSEHLEQWTQTAQRQIQRHVIGKDPARLQALSIDVLTTSELIKLLDFAHQTNKGIGWLDEFKPKTNVGWVPQIPKIPQLWEKTDANIISSAKQWNEKHGILDAHKEHLQFLAARRLSVSQFSNAVTLEANHLGLDALCVLPGKQYIAV